MCYEMIGKNKPTDEIQARVVSIYPLSFMDLPLVARYANRVFSSLFFQSN